MVSGEQVFRLESSSEFRKGRLPVRNPVKFSRHSEGQGQLTRIIPLVGQRANSGSGTGCTGCTDCSGAFRNPLSLSRRADGGSGSFLPDILRPAANDHDMVASRWKRRIW